MAFLDDIADLIAAEVDTIGLGTSASVEVSGGGYAAIAPAYGSASGGTVDVGSTLQFDGPSGTTISHVLYKRASAIWTAASAGPADINSDGRIDVTSAEIAVT